MILHIINVFVNKLNAVPDGDTLELVGNQVRVSGSLIQMGNPVQWLMVMPVELFL